MVDTVTATAILYEQKVKYARAVLANFVNEMIDTFGDHWQLNLEDTMKRALEKDKLYLDQLGNAYYQWSINGMSQRRMSESVERVVIRLEDIKSATIPPVQWFVTAFQQEMTEFDFSIIDDVGYDIFKDVVSSGQKITNRAVEVVGSVGTSLAKGVENIGDAVEGTTEGLSTLTKYLPLIIVGIIVSILVTLFKIGSNSKISKVV